MNTTEIVTQTIDTYNQYAPDYAAQWFNLKLHAQLDEFCSYLKPSTLVLDLGCGPGRDVQLLQARGYQVIGLDRSAGMLKEALNRNIRPLIQADIRHLPFARHAFGGIWACASLLHFPKTDLQPILEKLYPLLDHGYVFIALKENESDGQAEKWQKTGEHGNRFFGFYHPAEVELALERANFHVMSLRLDDAATQWGRWINIIGWTKLKSPKPAVNSVIFNDTGQVLLTRRTDNGLWCIPGGHIDLHETVETAAIREALEETGLQVEIERLSGMYNIVYPADLFPEKKPRPVLIIAFRCKIIAGELTLNDEVSEFGWFDLNNLPPDLILYHRERILDAL